MTRKADSDLTPDRIRDALRTPVLGRRLEWRQEAPSTNGVALELAQSDAPHGTLIVADHQTAGRGRLGRVWHSPPGCNLYWSLVLRPPSPSADSTHYVSWIPLVTGVAIARALHALGLARVSLKWPNDIQLQERKAGGVLCERTGLRTGNSAVVVGVGINVNSDPATFPEEFRDHTTSLATEAGAPFDRSRLLGEILAQLEDRLETMAGERHEDVVEEYRELCSTLRRQVRVHIVGGETLEGRADSIGIDGALRLIPNDATPSQGSEPIVIHAGDVVHVR